MNEKIVEPIFNVERVFNQGQTEVSMYEITLRVGKWTESIKVKAASGWRGDEMQTLKDNMADAKKTLMAKHELFAELFPEVNDYGETKIGREIRDKLNLPALEAPSTREAPKSVFGEVVA